MSLDVFQIDTLSDDLQFETRATDMTKPYAGARVNKLNNNWIPRHYSGDLAIKDSWDLLTSRIRDRVRNDAVLTRCKQALSRLVVGTGINSFSTASDLDPENDELEQFELESDIWFQRWAEEEADQGGELSFWEMQEHSFSEEVETGNIIWLESISPDSNRTVPIQYQLLEWEQVDMTRDRDAEPSRSGRGRRFNEIRNGIEYDSRGRKVAFYLYDDHPYDGGQWDGNSRRVLADRIIHEYHPSRPSARTGVTWFASLTQSNNDFDRLVGNELTTRGIQALMGVAVFSPDKNGTSGMSADDPETGVKQFQMGYPWIGDLGVNDKVEVVESKRSTLDNQPLQQLLLNLHSMGCGISLNRLLGDPAKANLASLKSAQREDDANMAPIQNRLGRQVVAKIRKRHNAWAFANGLYRSATARDLQRRPFVYNNFSQIGSQRSVADPEQTDDSINKLRSGLSNYIIECGRRNINWKRNLLAMRRVGKASEEMGVVLDWTKGQGSAPEQSSTVAQPAGATDDE